MSKKKKLNSKESKSDLEKVDTREEKVQKEDFQNEDILEDSKEEQEKNDFLDDKEAKDDVPKEREEKVQKEDSQNEDILENSKEEQEENDFLDDEEDKDDASKEKEESLEVESDKTEHEEELAVKKEELDIDLEEDLDGEIIEVEESNEENKNPDPSLLDRFLELEFTTQLGLVSGFIVILGIVFSIDWLNTSIYLLLIFGGTSLWCFYKQKNELKEDNPDEAKLNSIGFKVMVVMLILRDLIITLRLDRFID